ncbi:HD domain-containing protein [Aerococcaceae bacterium zg-ZJ1578]|uniref:HD domain-containing protein n=1 Tax=Aerococcaceae bacterium zg-252 TaxID=2796928 RepID=UPI001A233D22|nr:HD domain-containing protein [Aerococcaceae bacterium zg-1578]
MSKDWKQNQEYIDLIADLLETNEVQRLETFVHHKVTNRLAHSISVSYRSYLWAKRLNLDTRAVARAGLLHDLFFYEGANKHLIGGKGHNWEHPRIALKNALKLTELTDLEQDIIVKHMFGATLSPPKYPESLIVSLMDKQSAISELWIGARTYTNNVYRRYLKKVTTFLL